jgi:SPP1 gp7 family putative phage head morphogenesis protein
VFNNEIDRKKSRLFESLVASTAERHQSYKTAENLIVRQVKQYAIDLEDAIAMVAYDDVGVKKVMWVAEDDYKTCGECKALDGEIFPINETPPKQHINCRCVLIPVRE